MTDDESQFELLARGYFHQDWRLFDATPDEAVRHFARNEGSESAIQAASEIRALLDRPATEDDLAELWTRRYHAQFNPSRNGMTYRAWFEQMLEILESDRDVEPR